MPNTNNHKKIFKVALFADGPWSHNVLKKILSEDLIEVSFVCGRYKTRDIILQELCSKHNLKFFRTKNINSREFLEKIRNFNCELFISMSFDQIFSEEIIEMPKYKIINCHAGKLPFYRGRNILNWALINDEKEFGITVHYVDKEIDTGDIILQETFKIDDSDTYATLLKVAYVECANILFDAVRLFLRLSKIPRISQKTIHPLGFTCPKRKIGDELINWSSSSREIFNFVRALTHPGPLATTFIEGNQVKIIAVKLIEKSPTYIGIPGAILNNSIEGVDVKTGDSFIRIVDFNSVLDLKVGHRFESK